MREQAVHVVRLSGSDESAVPIALEIFDRACPAVGRQNVMAFRSLDDPALFALFCDWDSQYARQRFVENDQLREALRAAQERLGVAVQLSATLREVLSYGVQPRQARVITGALLQAQRGAGQQVCDLASAFYRRSVGWPGCVALFLGAASDMRTFFLVQEWERRQGLEYYLSHPDREAYLSQLGGLLEASPAWFEQIALWEYRRPKAEKRKGKE